MAWTDETKAKAVELYAEGNPTPANSTELCKQIADELGESPNGVRMVLLQAGVYIKKEVTSGSSDTAKKEGDAPKRVSKEAQIAELKAAIEARGGDIDDDILNKLTGKAAAYFTKVLTA